MDPESVAESAAGAVTDTTVRAPCAHFVPEDGASDADAPETRSVPPPNVSDPETGERFALEVVPEPAHAEDCPPVFSWSDPPTESAPPSDCRA